MKLHPMEQGVSSNRVGAAYIDRSFPAGVAFKTEVKYNSSKMDRENTG